MYFFLTGLKYSATSFKTSRFNFVSYFEPCNVLTSDSVGGCDVPPPNGEIAVSTISRSLYGGPAVIPESEEPGVTESEATWEDVPVTDEFGFRYDYTVIQPAKPEGYTSSTEGLTVTNTLTQ